MRDRSRDDRTVVVDPAGDQILQPLRGAAIGNEGDSDSDRRIQIRAWDPEAGPAVTFVPYRGAPQGLQDLIAGRIDYYCPVIAAGMPQILLK